MTSHAADRTVSTRPPSRSRLAETTPRQAAAPDRANPAPARGLHTHPPAAPTAPVQPAPEHPAHDALRRLADEVGKDQFERYFLGQTRLSMRDGELEVIAASGFLAQLLERRFGEHLRRATGAARMRFSVDRSAFPAQQQAPAPAGAAPQRKGPARPILRHTLDNFVVGQSNRLAHAAARRAVEDEGPTAPVFIYGSCGLGKTHLLQGVVNLFLKRRPDAVVRYVSGEAFTNEFISAIKANRVDQFRKMYRAVDLLAIDDVHFLAGKDATQGELLHTFDTVGLCGARILLASDEHPQQVRDLSSKLASRFMAGAVVRIDPPDPALRRALIRQISSRRRLTLDDHAVELLAQRSERAVGSLAGFGGSVREIEGLLNQVEAVWRLLPELGSRNGVIGAEVVRRSLGLENAPDAPNASPRDPRRPIHVQTIVDHVCRSLVVDYGEFVGKGRHKRVVLARALVAHLARQLTTQSFPEIARAMGRGNHSTVITAQRRLQRQLAANAEEILSVDLSPLQPGVSLAELIRTLTAQVRQSAR